jgi:hypothetical protein
MSIVALIRTASHWFQMKEIRMKIRLILGMQAAFTELENKS